MEKLLETRICAATELRRNLGLPSANTNAYRLVNSEGDRYKFLIFNRLNFLRKTCLNALELGDFSLVFENYLCSYIT